MFSGATSFNSDLSGWNVSQATKFVSFNLATSFFVYISCTLAVSYTFYYYILIISVESRHMDGEMIISQGVLLD